MHVFRRNAGTLSRQAVSVALRTLEPRASELALACTAVAQHEQARFVALAQPRVSDQLRRPEAAPQQLGPLPLPSDWDADHARRLAEIERAAAVRSRTLPSPEQVTERLRSHQGASCSSGSTNRTQQDSQHGGAEQPGLQWQDIVAALRHGDLEPARGLQILTDTFR